MNYADEVAKLLKEDSWLHLVSGLAAETGEVCAIFQKFCYKHQAVEKEQVLEELGDVYFYATALANKFGITMQEVLQYNIQKLKRRHNGL